MFFTRDQLIAMKLTDEQIELILPAYDAAIASLQDQLEQAQALAEADRALLLQQIEEMHRQQADALAAADQEAVQQLIRDALLKAGANEKALPLLAREVNPADAQLEEGQLLNADALIAPVAEKYAAFFAKPTRLPAQLIQPPQSLRGALTRQDVSRMSAEEINQNWAAVRTALSGL